MIINPLPNKLPLLIRNDPELFSYFENLNKSLYQIWHSLNGNLNLVLISTTKGINAKATGSTELFKIPSSKNFVPLYIVNRVTNFSAGSKSINAIVSFGGNPFGYDDFLNSSTQAVSAGNSFLINRPENSLILPIQQSGRSFRMIIETPSNASVEDWEIDLFGYLV